MNNCKVASDVIMQVQVFQFFLNTIIDFLNSDKEKIKCNDFLFQYWFKYRKNMLSEREISTFK